MKIPWRNVDKMLKEATSVASSVVTLARSAYDEAGREYTPTGRPRQRFDQARDMLGVAESAESWLRGWQNFREERAFAITSPAGGHRRGRRR